MIAHTDYQLAIRAHAESLTVASTGAIAMSATASGFVRSAGSFVTDGFRVGMELLASGFSKSANNRTGVITNVSPTLLSVELFSVSYDAMGTRTIARSATSSEASGSGRTLTIGLPTLRAWENVDFTPEPGIPYVEDQYVPGPSQQVTLGPNGEIEVRPMCAFLFYTRANSGLSASRYADALVSHFPPRKALALTNGDVLRVRSDEGPQPGQLQQARPGFAVKPVRVFFRIRTTNSI